MTTMFYIKNELESNFEIKKTKSINDMNNFEERNFDLESIKNENSSSSVQLEPTNLEAIELKQIVKLYKNLTLVQKKKFIANLIYTFDEKSLRNFNSSLESLRHKDFKYENKENKKILPNTKLADKLSRQSKQDDGLKASQIFTSFSKLPAIGESVSVMDNRSDISGKTSRLKKKKSKASRLLSGSQQSLVKTSRLGNDNSRSGTFQPPVNNLDIDSFIKKKNLDAINTPWILNPKDLNSKPSKNGKEATQNLVLKLKDLFREKYLPKRLSMDVSTIARKSLSVIQNESYVTINGSEKKILFNLEETGTESSELNTARKTDENKNGLEANTASTENINKAEILTTTTSISFTTTNTNTSHKHAHHENPHKNIHLREQEHPHQTNHEDNHNENQHSLSRSHSPVHSNQNHHNQHEHPQNHNDYYNLHQKSRANSQTHSRSHSPVHSHNQNNHPHSHSHENHHNNQNEHAHLHETHHMNNNGHQNEHHNQHQHPHSHSQAHSHEIQHHNLVNTSQNDKLKSIYIKKLKNNYYDRKLWYTLLLNKTNLFNYYTDNSVRDYNSEFNILNYANSTDLSFSKSLFKYSNNHPFYYEVQNLDRKNSELTNSVKLSEISLDDTEKHPTRLQKLLRQQIQNRDKYLITILTYMPKIKTWTITKKQTLFLMLIENDSDQIYEYFNELVKKRTKPVKSIIDHLPDNVLLNIFSRLDDQSLEVIPRVCKRWYYLANTIELWLYKCKKLGEDENLGNIEACLAEELAKDEDIDWRLAYYELKDFVIEIKLNYIEKINDLYDHDKSEKHISPSRQSYSYSMKSTRSSYVNFYSYGRYGRTERPETDYKELFEEFKSNSKISLKSMSHHKRSKLEKINESNRASVDESKLLKISEMSQDDRDKNQSIMTTKSDGYLKDFKRVRRRRPGDYVPIDYKEVKMELSQSKDLLNNLFPAFRLRWKMEDETVYDLKANEKIVFQIKPVNQVKCLTDHVETITCMDFDKKRLVTGGMDRLIYAYDIKNGRKIGKLEGHKGGIRCLQLLSNRLCSGSWDMTIIIWNMIRFEQVVTLSYNDDSVSCLYFDNSYLISGSFDKSIRVWQFTENHKELIEKSTEKPRNDEVIRFVRIIRHHKSAVTCLEYDGINCIVSGNTQGIILIIDINGELLHSLSSVKCTDPLTSLKLQGALVLASTKTGKVIFWNRRSFRCESIIKCHESQINAIAYFDEKFYTVGDDGLVKEWDLTTFTCLRQLRAHDGPVKAVLAFDSRIVSGGSDKAIIWEMQTDRAKSKNLDLKLNL